jgi:hypothetical protein
MASASSACMAYAFATATIDMCQTTKAWLLLNLNDALQRLWPIESVIVYTARFEASAVKLCTWWQHCCVPVWIFAGRQLLQKAGKLSARAEEMT